MTTQNKRPAKDIFVEYSIITLGVFLVAAGVYFFKIPNNFSTGGVSGIAIILSSFLPVAKATLTSIINMILLVVGFIFLGKSFGIKTIYGTVGFSAFLKLFEMIYPMTDPLTSEPLLELIFSVILPAVGSALLFNYSASSGGTDILAMIVKKYSSLEIGKALLCTDIIIATSSGILFGPETGMFSILGLLMKSVLVDNVMETINVSKSFTIITDKADEISDFILNEVGRGVTKHSCIGVYDNKEKYVLTSVMSRPQAKMVHDYIKAVDKSAFVIITTTSNIIGKGFRDPM